MRTKRIISQKDIDRAKKAFPIPIEEREEAERRQKTQDNLELLRQIEEDQSLYKLLEVYRQSRMVDIAADCNGDEIPQATLLVHVNAFRSAYDIDNSVPDCSIYSNAGFLMGLDPKKGAGIGITLWGQNLESIMRSVLHDYKEVTREQFSAQLDTCGIKEGIERAVTEKNNQEGYRCYIKTEIMQEGI